MEAFTSITLNKDLTKEEMQSWLTQKFSLLNQHLELIGLDPYACVPPSYPSDASSILGSMERAGGSQKSLLVQHSNREVTTSLSKSDKIEQIKEKMLDMLSFHIQ